MPNTCLLWNITSRKNSENITKFLRHLNHIYLAILNLLPPSLLETESNTGNLKLSTLQLLVCLMKWFFTWKHWRNHTQQMHYVRFLANLSSWNRSKIIIHKFTHKPIKIIISLVKEGQSYNNYNYLNDIVKEDTTH